MDNKNNSASKDQGGFGETITATKIKAQEDKLEAKIDSMLTSAAAGLGGSAYDPD